MLDSRLQSIFDRHRGCKTVFVMALGPTLADVDFSPFDPARHVVIACNTAFRRFPEATIAHHADAAWWRLHHTELLSTHRGELITGAGLGTNRPGYPESLVHVASNGNFVLGGKVGAVSGMNTGQQAITMAHWFQPQFIVLLGMDHTRGANGQVHWDGPSARTAAGHADDLWRHAMKWFTRFEQERASEWAALNMSTPLPEVLNASTISAITQFRKIDDLSPYL